MFKQINKYFFGKVRPVFLVLFFVAICSSYCVNTYLSKAQMLDSLVLKNDMEAQDVICYLKEVYTGYTLRCGELGCLMFDGGFCTPSDCFNSSGLPDNRYGYFVVDDTCRDANGNPLDEHYIEDPLTDYFYLEGHGMEIVHCMHPEDCPDPDYDHHDDIYFEDPNETEESYEPQQPSYTQPDTTSTTETDDEEAQRVEEAGVQFGKDMDMLGQELNQMESQGYNMDSLEGPVMELGNLAMSGQTLADDDYEGFWKLIDELYIKADAVYDEMDRIKRLGIMLIEPELEPLPAIEPLPESEPEPLIDPSILASMQSELDDTKKGIDLFEDVIDWFSSKGIDVTTLVNGLDKVETLYLRAKRYYSQQNESMFRDTMDEINEIGETILVPEMERLFIDSDLMSYFEEIGNLVEDVRAEADRLELNGMSVPPVYIKIENTVEQIGMLFESGEFAEAQALMGTLRPMIDEFWGGTQSGPPAGYEEEVKTVFSRNPFPDTVSGSLEGRAAADLYGKAVIGGFPDGEFKGERSVNRAEAAKFLLLAAGIEVQELMNRGRFWDVLEGEWYVKYVMTAAQKGIIGGYPDGSFKPANTVNTAEFLKMLSLAFGAELNLFNNFADVSGNEWFAQYAGIAQKYNLFPNRGGYLYPGNELTRNEVAVAIYQYLKNK